VAGRSGDLNVGINIQRWIDLLFTISSLLVARGTSGVPPLPSLAALVSEMSSVFGTVVPRFGSLTKGVVHSSARVAIVN
jgi:hypothetical protein